VNTFGINFFDNLEINLSDSDFRIIVVDSGFPQRYDIAVASGPMFLHSVMIDQDSRTAYIADNGNGHDSLGFYYSDEQGFYSDEPGEKAVLTLLIPADAANESNWIFDNVNIHIENGNLEVKGRAIDEYLAENINISLENGIIIENPN